MTVIYIVSLARHSFLPIGEGGGEELASSQ